MTLIHDSSGKGIGQENPLPTKVIESTIMQPVDIQSRYQQTIQTHNAVSVPATSWSVGSWIDCNGFDKVSVTTKIETATSNGANIEWSFDGATLAVGEGAVPTNTTDSKTAVIDIKARYARITFYNGDTAAHTLSAWAYLKA